MCARNECDNARLRILTTTRAHSRVHQVCHVIVGFHVLCDDFGFHVVIGDGRLTVQQEGFIRQLHFTTQSQHQVQSSFLLDVLVRLCPVIVHSICSQILAYSTSRKRVFRGVVFTPPVGYSRPPSAVNDLSVTK